ncbi:NusG domain II-containing protein [Dysosmobacter sp.]|uniref:NusG domain II-containing protein n=1 Tax=Dysosmobacter sp. TaxID=2591382 RepID=UPI002A8AEEA1|nr:NusG domain II-containing protein [Dysosmobacter sp.]MDY3281714.1 NusG domain II-containing protein [Dysosmobacter sp.]
MKSSIDLCPTRWDLLVAAVILLLAGGCALALGSAGDGGALTAVVSVDGAEVDRVALDRLSGPERRTYEASGYVLTVEFSPEGAAVAESDCPTQDCVHTGTVRSRGRSIVCLPARLTVRLTGGDDGGVDAVIG